MAQKRVLLVVYTVALLMSVLDVTIVNVALPSVSAEFRVSTAAVGSASVGYLAAFAAVIPAAGWLSDRLGGTPALLGGIGIFTIASFACGVAPDLLTLVLARVVQGIGGGLLVSVGLGLVYQTYPPAERVRVTAKTALVTGLAPILGPTLGGVLVTSFSWRWVFFVNVPLGAFALVLGSLRLHRFGARSSATFDTIGFVLAAAGVGATICGLSAMAGAPTNGLLPLIITVGGLVILCVFTVHQRRKRSPLVNLSLLKTSPFAAMSLVTVLGNGAFFGALYLIALFLQGPLRLDPLGAGLVMLAEAIPVLIGAQLVSRRLYQRMGPIRLVKTGLIGLALTLASMSILTPSIGLIGFAVQLMALGTSWSFVFLPTTTHAFTKITAADTAQGSALFNTFRQAGAALGIALSAIALTAFTGPVPSFPVAFAVIAAEAVVLVIVMFRYREG